MKKYENNVKNLRDEFEQLSHLLGEVLTQKPKKCPASLHRRSVGENSLSIDKSYVRPLI